MVFLIFIDHSASRFKIASLLTKRLVMFRHLLNADREFKFKKVILKQHIYLVFLCGYICDQALIRYFWLAEIIELGEPFVPARRTVKCISGKQP